MRAHVPQYAPANLRLGARANPGVVGHFRIAQEARATLVPEGVAQSRDRVRETFGRDERSAWDVRDGNAEGQRLEQHLRHATVEHEPPDPPTRRRPELAPGRGLQNVRLTGRDDQLIPALDVDGRRLRRPQAARLLKPRPCPALLCRGAAAR